MAKASIAQPPRCAYFNPNAALHFCSIPAAYARQTIETGALTFFCRDHARESDRPIGPSTPVRRISLRCEIAVTGVTNGQQLGEQEALTRVQLACLEVGALVEVQEVTSTTTRCRVPRPAVAPRGR